MDQVHLDEPTLQALNRTAPAAKRQRAEFIRIAVKDAIRKREYARIREAYTILNKSVAAETTATGRSRTSPGASHDCLPGG